MTRRPIRGAMSADVLGLPDKGSIPPRHTWYKRLLNSHPDDPMMYCDSCGAAGVSGRMMIHHYATCEFRPGGGCEIDDIDDFDGEDVTND